MNNEKNKKETQYVSIRIASQITGIHPQTLRKLCDDNKIQYYRTPSKQRKFNKSYLEEMLG